MTVISLEYNFCAEQRVSSNLIGQVAVYMLLYTYGFVSQGLGTTKFMNLIG